MEFFHPFNTRSKRESFSSKLLSCAREGIKNISLPKLQALLEHMVENTSSIDQNQDFQTSSILKSMKTFLIRKMSFKLQKNKMLYWKASHKQVHIWKKKTF